MQGFIKIFRVTAADCAARNMKKEIKLYDFLAETVICLTVLCYNIGKMY